MKDAYVTRKEIEAVKSPKFTKTWHPISHKLVLDAIGTVVEKEGIGIVNETYSTRLEGLQMFGALTLDISYGGISNPQFGFRNALDKGFSLGFCSGNRVIACSNMCFSGEFITFRRHTGLLDYDELVEIAGIAFGKIISKAEKMNEWQVGLQQVELPRSEFKQLTFDAMDKSIIAPNRFSSFIKAHEEEVELAKGDESLYQFHGAVTRLSRGDNLLMLSDRTGKLNKLCDDYKVAKAA